MNRSPAADKPYGSAAKAIDKAFGKVPGGLFRLLTARLGRKDIPSYEDYTYESKSTFFKGTDGDKATIIALSANAFEEDVQESLSMGMNAHVAKPIDVNTLFETMKSLTK